MQQFMSNQCPISSIEEKHKKKNSSPPLHLETLTKGNVRIRPCCSVNVD